MNELKNLLESAGLSAEIVGRLLQIHEAQVQAGVDSRLDEQVRQIQESAEARFNTRLGEAVDLLATNLGKAMDEAVTGFMTENAETLVENARMEMALAAVDTLNEAFAVLGLTNDKALVESVENMRKQVDEKDAAIAAVQTELKELKEAEDKRVKGDLLKEAAVGLTDFAADRLQRLAESFGPCTPEQYATRLGDLKDTFKMLAESAATAKPAAGAAKPLNEAAGAGVDPAAADAGNGVQPINESQEEKDRAAALHFMRTGRFPSAE